jgi:hypothetical protein
MAALREGWPGPGTARPSRCQTDGNWDDEEEDEDDDEDEDDEDDEEEDEEPEWYVVESGAPGRLTWR